VICIPISRAINQIQAGDRAQLTLICDHIHVVQCISGSNVLLNPLQFSNCIGCNSGPCWIESYGHSIRMVGFQYQNFHLVLFIRINSTLHVIGKLSIGSSLHRVQLHVTETAAFKLSKGLLGALHKIAEC
jgi:hypothetical protein